MAGRSTAIKAKATSPSHTDDLGAISQSVPANFYSSRRPPPPTPNLGPSASPADEAKMPDLIMPGTSPNAHGILDKSGLQGSYSLKDDTSPLATMSMPVQSGLRGRDRDDDELAAGMGDLKVGSLNVLTIIEEGSATRDPVHETHPQIPIDVPAADDDGDGDPGIFELEMED